MCFYIKTKRKLKAKRDITCYKKINSNMTPYMKDIIPEIIAFGKYKFNHLYNDLTKINILKLTRCNIVINIGFHSFIKKNHKFMENDIDVLLVKCIIPKGAYYYVNDTEYVSDQIIIIEEI